MRKRASASCAESADVGSSMRITSARCARALAISTVCISATPSSFTARAGGIGAPRRPRCRAASASILERSIHGPRVGSCPMRMFSATVISGKRRSS